MIPEPFGIMSLQPDSVGVWTLQVQMVTYISQLIYRRYLGFNRTGTRGSALPVLKKLARANFF